jgi:hypothetical protein
MHLLTGFHGTLDHRGQRKVLVWLEGIQLDTLADKLAV